jgi:hypothetical protein
LNRCYRFYLAKLVEIRWQKLQLLFLSVFILNMDEKVELPVDIRELNKKKPKGSIFQWAFLVLLA